MDITSGTIETSIIGSKFTHQEKSESLDSSESLMHHKEQHEEGAYYKQLSQAIKQYDDVVLFGATQAKKELYNILRADHSFEKIRVEVKPTDRLTEPQQEAFVRAHFAKR
jgi:acetyl-CoA carboxylase beta subunit